MQEDWSSCAENSILNCGRAQVIILHWKSLFNHRACQEQYDWNAKTTLKDKLLEMRQQHQSRGTWWKNETEDWFHVLKWENTGGVMRTKRQEGDWVRQNNRKKEEVGVEKRNGVNKRIRPSIRYDSRTDIHRYFHRTDSLFIRIFRLEDFPALLWKNNTAKTCGLKQISKHN